MISVYRLEITVPVGWALNTNDELTVRANGTRGPSARVSLARDAEDRKFFFPFQGHTRLENSESIG